VVAAGLATFVFSSDDSSTVDLCRFQHLKITVIRGSHSDGGPIPSNATAIYPMRNGGA